MIVNGQRREFLSLDRGDRQIERVLELLAVVTSGPGPDLKEALALDALHFGRNTVAIVITPSSSRDWHEGLRHLQRRGVKVAVVGLDAATFDGSPPDEDTLALLEGAGIPVARVKRGDSLIHVLESSHETRYALRR
jgi:FAD/FMN-containing dehydrogenase